MLNYAEKDLIELLINFVKYIGIEDGINHENIGEYLHYVIDTLDIYIGDVTTDGETYATIKDISTYYHDCSSNKFVVGKIRIHIDNISRILKEEV